MVIFDRALPEAGAGTPEGARVSRVIYVNGRYLTQAITGVQRYAHDLMLAIDRLLDDDLTLAERCRFVVLTPPRGLIHEPRLRNIEVRSAGRLSGHVWEQLDLPRASRDGLLFCPCNTAPVASLLLGRTVVTVHDLSYRYFPNAYSLAFRTFYRVLIPIVLGRASAVITVSNATRDAICVAYPRVSQRITAIQNGGLPDDVVHDGGQDIEQKESFALYVGAMSRRKNVQGVLQAAALLADEDLEFVIAGGGGRPFKHLAVPKEFNRSAKLRFTDHIGDHELSQYYRRALCLVFPSFYEASPLPPIEAMAWGCPVIASPIAALRERCGDAALYCDPDDPADIAKGIQTLQRDPGKRSELRQKGFKQARRFSWRNCALQTLQVVAGVERSQEWSPAH